MYVIICNVYQCSGNIHISIYIIVLLLIKSSILFCFIADDVHTVYVESDNNPRVVLCHLSKSANLFQCSLDHVFFQGTDLKFVTSASANIHMTGICRIVLLKYIFIYLNS